MTEQRSPRLLVVDDQSVNRMFVRATLRSAGFEITEGETYQQARNAAATLAQAGGRFAVVVTDWQYPGVDPTKQTGGRDLLLYFKDNPDQRPDQIAVMTSRPRAAGDDIAALDLPFRPVVLEKGEPGLKAWLEGLKPSAP